MNKKSQLTLFFVFFISAVLIITTAALLAPMGVLFNTKMYEAGEDIYLRTNASLSDINNTAVRANVQDTINNGLAATETNIDINGDMFQYSWIIFLILTGVIIFLIARQRVEFTQGGFI